MDLILIRHAQPDWAPGGVADTDPRLTELGHRQSTLLAEEARRWAAVDELLVSPATRARQTAAPLEAAAGQEVTVLDWLEEIRNPADWHGSPVETIVKVLEEGRLRPIEEMWEGLPGGETFRGFHERVCGGLEGALAERGVRRMAESRQLWEIDEPGGTVVLVAHAGTNAVLLGTLLGLEPVPWEWERFASAHASVSRVTTHRVASGHAFSLRSFSDVGHLPAELVTA